MKLHPLLEYSKIISLWCWEIEMWERTKMQSRKTNGSTDCPEPKDTVWFHQATHGIRGTNTSRDPLTSIQPQFLVLTPNFLWKQSWLI